MAMGSRPLLLLGNIVAIVVTIVAFVRAITSHPAAKTSATTHPSQTEAKIPQHRPAEKHSTPNHPSSTRIDQRTPPKPEPVRTLGPKVVAKLTAPTINTPKPGLPKVEPTPRPPAVKQGPNFNPTIAKGDYMEYDVELEAGKDFSGEVT